MNLPPSSKYSPSLAASSGLRPDRKWRRAMRLAQGHVRRRKEREEFYRYGVTPWWWR